MKKRQIIYLFAFTFILSVFSFAEDSLGDFSELDNFNTSDDSAIAEKKFNVKVGGNINTGVKIFLNDFNKFKDIRPSSLVWGNLYVHAEAPITEAYFGVNLNDMTLPFNLKNKPELYPRNPQIPAFIDEAYMQLMLGDVVFGGGIKKLTWGRADAFSVLDIINPQDYSDASISDPQKLKIARPMMYLSAYLPKDMKLDLVFLPVFEGNRIATTGRWKPIQFKTMQTGLFTDMLLDSSVPNPLKTQIASGAFTLDSQTSLSMPTEIDAGTLKYAQAGLRLTGTVVGVHDLGFQYYYGRLTNPALNFSIASFLGSLPTTPSGKIDEELLKKAFAMDYNEVHQIGVDYASALGVVNLRAELAANITTDLKGDNPSVYNPFMAWHIGMDYTTPFGMMFNVGVSENIKLMYNKIGTKLYDLEKGQKQTDTKIMFLISQSLLRDSIKLDLRTVMACETLDFYMAPSLAWTYGTLDINAGMGFFFGKKDGVLSQYKNNNFMHFSISYHF